MVQRSWRFSTNENGATDVQFPKQDNPTSELIEFTHEYMQHFRWDDGADLLDEFYDRLKRNRVERWLVVEAIVAGGGPDKRELAATFPGVPA